MAACCGSSAARWPSPVQTGLKAFKELRRGRDFLAKSVAARRSIHGFWRALLHDLVVLYIGEFA